ncbi:WXG100 family type VII secretion target [Arthrobacter sp. HLT1-20]
MSGTFIGADVAQLRGFAQDLSACSKHLTTISASLNNALAALPWQGPDSERFRRAWSTSQLRSIRGVCAELESVAQVLLRNAQEQDAASSSASLDTGGSLPTSLSGTPGVDVDNKLAGMSSGEIDKYLQSEEFETWVRESQANADAAKTLVDKLADSGQVAMLGPDKQANGYGAFLEQYWAESAMRAAGIDPAHWDPAQGVDYNREDIYKVYAFYAELYKNDPRMEWIGMANQVGPTFIAGFEDLAVLHKMAATGQEASDFLSDMDPLRYAALQGLMNLGEADLAYYETSFLSMQKQIFTDIGSQHFAYQQGGLAEIERMDKADLVTDRMRQAWLNIDSVPDYANPQDYHRLTGSQQNALHQASLNIADREQNYVIADDYDAIRSRPSGTIFTEAMTVLGQPSIVGAQSYYEKFPAADPYLDVGRFPPLGVDVHHGNISVREDRWALIDQDTLGAYEYWLHSQENPYGEMMKPMPERVDEYRMVPTTIRNLVGEP